MPANTIYYSDKYYDDTFEYRCAPNNTRAFCDAPSVGPRGAERGGGGRAGT